METHNIKRVAIVTGSNKGIGFEIVKGLCQKFDGIVYLTGLMHFYISILNYKSFKVFFCYSKKY
jgi:hypothetical protein